MQIIDNWAMVEGSVDEVRPGAVTTTVIVRVVATEDFEDYPNLFTWAKGQLLTVVLPAASSVPEIGQSIRWRLKIVKPGQSEPHPSSLIA